MRIFIDYHAKLHYRNLIKREFSDVSPNWQEVMADFLKYYEEEGDSSLNRNQILGHFHKIHYTDACEIIDRLCEKDLIKVDDSLEVRSGPGDRRVGVSIGHNEIAPEVTI